MKTNVLLILWLGVAIPCSAQKVLVNYDWQHLTESGVLLGGVPIQIDGRSGLRILNTNDTPLQLQLLKIPKPPISQKLYALEGELKYEAVRGEGYLEMWNYFPPLEPGMPEGQYFSRTLGVGGEMGKILGTSNWRPFRLRFDSTGSTGTPTRLELNIFLPGTGTVYLGPLKLVEYSRSFQNAGMTPNAWWSGPTAGLVGGVGGGVLGCLGSLMAFLAGKGVARRFVITVAWAMIGLGGLLGITGLVALGLHQPYAVWFPLLLGATLLLTIIPSRLRNYLKHYENLELRRMAAFDALQA